MSNSMPDHEEALCRYLDDHGVEHEHVDGKIIVHSESGSLLLVAAFDDMRRLIQVEAVPIMGIGFLEEDAMPPSSSPATASSAWDTAQLRRMMGG